MEIVIENSINVADIWAGIGGHFDSLGQIVNEFIDNSISNMVGNRTSSRNIIISLKELFPNGSVKVTIEDSGTGMKDLSKTFTLGNREAPDSPLNEHGFGLKHALASANPDNDAWSICTRTAEDYSKGQFKKIVAPYKIEGFSATIDTGAWPGQLNGTGTFVEFTCSRDMYRTIARGTKASSFKTIADVLCEEIGFIYAGVIKDKSISITLKLFDSSNNENICPVGIVEPDWDDFFQPGSGSESYDLGGGPVTIKYQFGKINEKEPRKEFENTTSRKYYKKNMASSGVEIRLNGRVICNNLFTEIWGIEKHNSYNYLLITLDLISDKKNALPETRTSKNGLREGDPKLEKIYNWVRSKLTMPEKDISLSDHEVDLFQELCKRKNEMIPDPAKVIDTEHRAFVTTTNDKDRVRIDLYENCIGQTTIYEGKKDKTSSKDVYQLRMYWDGLVYDKVPVNKGVLVAKEHPDSVYELLKVVNSMTDANGIHYCLEAKKWSDLGLNVK